MRDFILSQSQGPAGGAVRKSEAGPTRFALDPFRDLVRASESTDTGVLSKYIPKYYYIRKNVDRPAASRCLARPHALDARRDMAKKIQLNDAQWNRLQRLASEKGKSALDESTGVSDRLRSNGLVATDRKGCEYLTEQGARRLSQGR